MDLLQTYREEIAAVSSIRRKVIVIIIDGVGCGALADAHEYGDEGANTLAHVADFVGGLDLQNLQSLGLGNIIDIKGVAPSVSTMGGYGAMGEASKGKDTTTGHWELMGLITETPFRTYPCGFPSELMERFEAVNGCGFLGNKPASGTEIIAELGSLHIATGTPIIYTSGDSVFQIAAHEEVIPPTELYRICERTRSDVLTEEDSVARVIARPFTGTADEGFTRTSGRHDYAIPPSENTVLDAITGAGLSVYGVGKISDIFCGQGITNSYPTTSNQAGMEITLDLVKNLDEGLIFTNLVDFDMHWGHRRDAQGFAQGLLDFDKWLGTCLAPLPDNDLLIITADHGCDPTFKGTDHTREAVPLLIYSKMCKGRMLGVAESFTPVAKITAGWLGVPWTKTL